LKYGEVIIHWTSDIAIPNDMFGNSDFTVERFFHAGLYIKPSKPLNSIFIIFPKARLVHSKIEPVSVSDFSENSLNLSQYSITEFFSVVLFLEFFSVVSEIQ